MRVQNSMKNILMGILTQIVITLLGFLCRKTFLDSLGVDYLGVNGLLQNILSMLSLVEGGIGVNIIYHLYRPLADKDEERIISLTQLYKKLYFLIAIIVLVLSLGLYPLLGIVIDKSSSIPYLMVVYFIFVLRNVLSYLNSHKRALITADQKGYILSKYDLIFNMITTIFKIIILQYTQNYVLYLVVDLISFIINLLWCNKIIRKYYSFILTRKAYTVDKEVKTNLLLNFKAIILHNIGGYCVTGTDNLLISGLISLNTVGIYSNYTMIISQLSALLYPIINGVSASIGNLIAVESKEKNYQIFNVLNLVTFWIYSLSSIFLYNLLEPFIEWWIGDNYLLSHFVFIIIIFNFYLNGMRHPVLMFKNKGAIFAPDRYLPLVEAVINLGASVLLAKRLGLGGIFLGTTISTLVIPFWTQPKLVYNIIFEKGVFSYYRRYIYYFLLMLFVGFGTTFFCTLVSFGGLSGLIIKGLICCILPNVFYVYVFYRTKEFNYIITAFLPYIRRIIPLKYRSELMNSSN